MLSLCTAWELRPWHGGPGSAGIDSRIQSLRCLGQVSTLTVLRTCMVSLFVEAPWRHGGAMMWGSGTSGLDAYWVGPGL